MKLSEEEEKKIQEAARPSQPLRTFSSDLADAVRRDEMSVIKVAMAEQKRRQATDDEASPTSTKNIRYIVGGIIILILAGGAIYGIIKYKSGITPDIPITETKIVSVIPADMTTSIEIANQSTSQVTELIRSAIANVQALEGNIIDIYLTNSISGTKKIIGTEEFFGILESQIPAPLLRSLAPKYMLGMIMKGGPHPFIILKSTDYETSFANMFTWEKKIFHDFYIPLSLVGGERAFESRFTDLLVENKAIRILYSETKEVIMLYSFINEQTMVITKDIETFKTLRKLIEAARPE